MNHQSRNTRVGYQHVRSATQHGHRNGCCVRDLQGTHNLVAGSRFEEPFGRSAYTEGRVAVQGDTALHAAIAKAGDQGAVEITHHSVVSTARSMRSLAIKADNASA